MIKQIAHVCLNVHDLDRTIAFYQGILDFPIRFTYEKEGRTIGLYFEICPGNYIEVFEKKDVAVANTGIVHFCLETDDIDDAIRTLESRGIACTPKKTGSDRSFQTWIQDPDGNRIELHQYTENSAQRTGGVVQAKW